MRKIIFTAITLTLWLHATPVTLNNEGLITGLEKFKPICEYYGDIIKDSHKVKRLCGKYNKRLNNVLQAGYRMDKYIVPTTHTHMYQGKMHTCTNQTYRPTKYDTKLLNRYRSDVFSLDKLREEIIEYAGREKYNARTHYDAEYHEKLIREDVIDLYPSDYIFIAEHKEVYAKAGNPRYTKMIKDKREELFSQEEREYLAQQRKKEENRKERENARWIEECGYDMTAERHYAKKGGKISGKVSGSDLQGYFVENWGGGEKTTFYVVGGPLHTGGYVTSPIYVISKGGHKRTIATNMGSGVKATGTALIVYYNDACVKN